METLDREKLIKCQQKYETLQEPNLGLLSKTGFKWIELLESEFDKRFLELDSFLNRLLDCPPNENEKDENVSSAKGTLNELSSIFAQVGASDSFYATKFVSHPHINSILILFHSDSYWSLQISF